MVEQAAGGQLNASLDSTAGAIDPTPSQHTV